jgi:hypothetical protein
VLHSAVDAVIRASVAWAYKVAAGLSYELVLKIVGRFAVGEQCGSV